MMRLEPLEVNSGADAGVLKMHNMHMMKELALLPGATNTAMVLVGIRSKGDEEWVGKWRKGMGRGNGKTIETSTEP